MIAAQEEFEESKILLVEDNPDVAEPLVYLLKLEGYETFIAGNGLQALKLLNTRPNIDVILLDYSMPQMDGKTFVEVLRQDARFTKMPVVVLSSNPSMMEGLPVQAFLEKPARIDRLLATIRRILLNPKE